MPFLAPAAMTAAEPLPGWQGRFFHSEHMTFAHYDVAADAAALHEHHHLQEEVWHVVEGEIAFSIDGEERVLGPGDAAVVPANTLHSARALKASRAVVVDYPLRHGLPGRSHSAPPPAP
jgi:mannose-6-phosphate isomerase-like protein (cupin superfamily)